MEIHIEHHYILTNATEKEARDYQREVLRPKYEHITSYSTPFDHHIVCHTPIE